MRATVSTKCWEGDYRSVLTVEVLAELFDDIAPEGPRQVVLNRIVDREAADRLAAALVESGHLTRYAWAEDLWPEVAARLKVPVTWFGAAWPYSVPELCELHLAETDLLLHLAGDVRALPTALPWLPRAVSLLDHHAEVAAAAPTTPSGSELLGRSALDLAQGWVATQYFSDQLFLGRVAELLSPELVRATHPNVGRYPKPGGALTFEARVCAWMSTAGRWRATDATCSYRHPVAGAEGDSYTASAQHPVLLPPVVSAGPAYPPPGSVPLTGVVVARNQERTVGHAVASLAWCSRVLVLDQKSEDRTVEIAEAAGATVHRVPVIADHRSTAGEAAGPGWLFLLEGDELVPPDLAHRVADLVRDGHAGGVEMARSSYVFGQRAAGAGWWPDYQLRVFDASASGGPPLRLEPRPELSLLRFGSAGLDDWVHGTNLRTRVEAQGKSFDKNVSGRHALKEVLRRFFRERGWRMGRRGLTLSLLGGLHTWMYVEKAVEATKGGETATRAHYDEIAASVLAGRGTPPA